MLGYICAVALGLPAELRAVQDQDPWQFVGPDQIEVSAFAVFSANPPWLYASTAGGFYRSEDGGNTWIRTSSIPEPPVTVLAVGPDDAHRVYMGTELGMYASADGGESWRSFNELSQPLYNRAILSLAVDPRAPNVLYAGVDDGAFKSEDGGQSWRSISFHPAGTADHIRTLIVDPVDSQVLYAGSQGGVYKSTDGGQTLSLVSPGTDASVLVMGRTSPFPLYSSTRRGARHSYLQVSRDRGATWVVSGELLRVRQHMEGLLPPTVTGLAVDPRNSRVVYMASRESGLQLSTDGGEQWRTFNESAPIPGDSLGTPPDLVRTAMKALVVTAKPPYLLYAASASGVFRVAVPDSLGTSDAAGDGEEPPSPSDSVVVKGTLRCTGPTIRVTATLHVGAAVTALVAHPEDPEGVYAGTPGGLVFRRGADGAWVRRSAGLPTALLHTLVGDPNDGEVLYAGFEGGAGLYKSVDGGQSWSPANGGRIFSSVFVVAVDPNDSQTLYAGLRTAILKSTDGGQSWEIVFRETTEFTSIAVDPQNSQIVYAGSWGIRDVTAHSMKTTGVSGVHKSEDGGQSWRRVADKPVYRLLISPGDPRVLYAVWKTRAFDAEVRSRVSRSRNGGETWEPFGVDHEEDVPLFFDDVALDSGNASVVYGAVGEEVFKSADGGSTWQMVGRLAPGMRVHVMSASPRVEGRLYLGTGHGVFDNADVQEESTHPGLQAPDRWVPLDHQAFPDEVVTAWTLEAAGVGATAFAVSPQEPFQVYATAHDSVLCRQQDGSWKFVGRMPEPRWKVFALVPDPQLAERLYAGTGMCGFHHGRSGGVMRSDDGGRNWSQINRRSLRGISVAIDPRDPRFMFVGMDGWVLWSGDGGISYPYVVPARVFQTEAVYGTIAFDPFDENRIYVEGYALYTSQNRGRSWSTLLADRVREIGFDWYVPGHLYAVLGVTLTETENWGRSWRPTSDPISISKGRGCNPRTYLTTGPLGPGNLYVAAGEGVLESVDGGASWSDISAGLEGEVYAVVADLQRPGVLYCGTEKGIYRIARLSSADSAAEEDGASPPADPATEEDGASPPADPAAEEGDASLPAEFVLEQNFPNPFNGRTVIEYQLPQSAIVELGVYNFMGQKVKKLVQEAQGAGTYRTAWNGHNDDGRTLASGVYLYRLRAGEYVQTRKLLLLR